MKVAVLWPLMQGYLNACLKELAARGVELLVVHREPASDAPFDTKQFAWFHHQIMWRTEKDLAELEKTVTAFAPDVLLVAGWAYPAYRRTARALRGKCVRLMTMDNPWKWEARQYLATWFAGRWLRTLAEAIWVPGERQAIWAKKLGFGDGRVLLGSLSCDWAAMDAVYRERRSQAQPLPHAFLYVGRLAAEKGLDTLVAAYSQYRSISADPWPLICCGTGPLGPLLEGQPGIHNEGFVQPEDMAARYAGSGCLILPSTREAWALVLHEASAAGLVMVSSDAVGGNPHFVQPYYNGFIFQPGDVRRLCEIMTAISSLPSQQLETMSEASHSLSRQFTPQRWADTLLDSRNLLRR